MEKRSLLICALSVAMVFAVASNCPAPVCGDWIIQPDRGEECDINNDAACPGQCNLDPYDDIPDCTCPEVVEEVCWLTGGGAKFEPLVGLKMATADKTISIGGNVNPGCSAIAGDGGNWNLIDHNAKLHFQGTHIEVVECGNIPESIRPPGSSSPKTPFNYIEYQGTGTLNGIGGNKVKYDPVCFYARAEDRSEPGTKENLGSSFIDRFWLRVDDCAGGTLYLFGADVADPDTLCGDDSFACTDTIALTGGNLQIHISSCP